MTVRDILVADLREALSKAEQQVIDLKNERDGLMYHIWRCRKNASQIYGCTARVLPDGYDEMMNTIEARFELEDSKKRKTKK